LPRVRPIACSAVEPGPRAYARGRATALGRITEALEQRSICGLVGPVDGGRILDLGCGDGVLASILADRGAWAVGIDSDRAMLEAAALRAGHQQGRRPRFVEGRVERLPFRDGVFDVVVAVTVLCLVGDRVATVREAARVLRPGGQLVIGDLGRWSAWAAERRVRAWLGSRLWRSAHFSTAGGLSRLVERAGLRVEAVRGSIYYPPIGALARPLAFADRWLGHVTTVGAAFIALTARKPADWCQSVVKAVIDREHPRVLDRRPERRDDCRTNSISAEFGVSSLRVRRRQGHYGTRRNPASVCRSPSSTAAISIT
jgi:SAM-dependent methyltransferase